MIPLTILYVECIDRPRLNEQRDLFEYIVASPLSGVRTIKNFNICRSSVWHLSISAKNAIVSKLKHAFFQQNNNFLISYFMSCNFF